MRLEIRDRESVKILSLIGKKVWIPDGSFRRPGGVREREAYEGTVVGVDVTIKGPGKPFKVNRAYRVIVLLHYHRQGYGYPEVTVWSGDGSLHHTEAACLVSVLGEAKKLASEKGVVVDGINARVSNIQRRIARLEREAAR